MSSESSLDNHRSMESRGSRKLTKVASISQLKLLMLEEAFKEVDDHATNISDAGLTPFSPPVLDRRSGPSASALRLPTDVGTIPTPIVSRQNSSNRVTTDRLRRTITASTDPFENALPVMPIKSSLSSHLKRECQRGIEFLIQSQRPAYSRTSDDLAPNMPKTALQFSKVSRTENVKTSTLYLVYNTYK